MWWFLNKLFMGLMMFFAVAGIVLLLAGSGFATYTLAQSAWDAHRYLTTLDAQQPLTAAVFNDSQPGRVVLVMGTISPDTPALRRGGLVVYIAEVYDSEDGWGESGRELQPLTLVVANPAAAPTPTAPVQIEHPTAGNAHYQLYNLPVVSTVDDRRWRGVVPGDAVVVLGSVAYTAELAYLDAAMLCAGDVAVCGATLWWARLWNTLGSIGMGIFTTLVLVLIVALIRTR